MVWLKMNKFALEKTTIYYRTRVPEVVWFLLVPVQTRQKSNGQRPPALSFYIGGWKCSGGHGRALSSRPKKVCCRALCLEMSKKGERRFWLGSNLAHQQEDTGVVFFPALVNSD